MLYFKVKISFGLYHGTQPLYQNAAVHSQPVDTLSPDWKQDIEFNTTLGNLPPGSKLCCSIHFHRRRTSLLISVRCYLFRKIFIKTCICYNL